MSGCGSEASQHLVSRMQVRQHTPTLGVPLLPYCSKAPSRGRSMQRDTRHETPPRRWLRDMGSVEALGRTAVAASFAKRGQAEGESLTRWRRGLHGRACRRLVLQPHLVVLGAVDGQSAVDRIAQATHDPLVAPIGQLARPVGIGDEGAVSATRSALPSSRMASAISRLAILPTAMTSTATAVWTAAASSAKHPWGWAGPGYTLPSGESEVPAGLILCLSSG